MTSRRLLLFVITALAGIGAIYFYAMKVVAAAAALLLLAIFCLGLFFYFRSRRHQP